MSSSRGNPPLPGPGPPWAGTPPSLTNRETRDLSPKARVLPCAPRDTVSMGEGSDKSESDISEGVTSMKGRWGVTHQLGWGWTKSEEGVTIPRGRGKKAR